MHWASSGLPSPVTAWAAWWRWICAGRHRARVRAVAMVAGTAPMPVSDAILEACANNDHAAFDMLTQWGYSKRHQYGGNSNPGIWMVAALAVVRAIAARVLHADMNACNNYQAGLERAAQVTCPVLMVLGRDETPPPRATDQLQAALRSPDVRIVEGAGHTLMVGSAERAVGCVESRALKVLRVREYPPVPP